jgi:hypothetical protein
MAELTDYAVENIVRKLNSEYARGLLTQYFLGKGFEESFTMRVYPPSMQDLVECIQELDGKCEVVPTSEEIDPRDGYAKIRWDLYVLGNNRLFLGFSEHTDLSSLARQLGQGAVVSEDRQSSYEVTPMKVITFVCRILESSRQGILRNAAKPQPQNGLKIPNVGATFFRHGSPSRFEQH